MAAIPQASVERWAFEWTPIQANPRFNWHISPLWAQGIVEWMVYANTPCRVQVALELQSERFVPQQNAAVLVHDNQSPPVASA